MGSPELAIACVLKTGRWHTGHNYVRYEPKHVQWLKRQCDQHAPGVRFVCLTNESKIDGVDTIPLQYNWPGWWSKMEMFGHDLGRVLYMDLDTVIVGPLDGMLAYPHQFTALNSLGKKSVRLLNSGLLAWQGARPDLFEPFKRDPQRWINECRTAKCWGDQGFIARHIGDKWEAWQNLFPGSVGSYKNTWKRQKPPASARVVCFHGTPKPYEVNHDWVPKC